MANTSAAGHISRYKEFCRERQDEMLRLLEQMVEIESPSDNKAAVDKLGEFLAQTFRAEGGRVEIHQVERYGNHLQIEFSGQSGRKPIMLLGHFDTVWPLGTLAKMPFRTVDDRIYGPGVLDMKASFVMVIYALRALRQREA